MKRNKIYANVFLWMCIGLLVTFGVGYLVSTNENMIANIYGGMTWLVLAIIEIVVAIFLQARIQKLSPIAVTITYLLYTFLSGLTFSSIFIVYEVTSIIYIFLIASIVFLIFAFIGYVTKMDLTKIGTFLMMALLGLVICLIVNVFLNSDTFDIVLSCISLVIFIGYTAYDIQIIKRLETSNMLHDRNIAIYGAFQLYLDFINIFLDLLRLFGNSND